MDLNLKGTSALILASSRGLGRSIAHGFAQEGARLMISGRHEESLRKTAQEISECTGAEVNWWICDVTQPEQIVALVAQTIACYGSIDALINNAGGPPSGSFDTFSDADWHNTFELSLLSYIRAIRAVLPIMRKRKKGRIVNIASSSFKQSIDDLVMSNTFRPGVVGLSKTLSQELGKDKILINTVGPGKIETTRVAELDRRVSEKLSVSYEQVRKKAEAEVPLGRYGTAEEFARLVVFLGSPSNTYITGQAVLVDGGSTRAL